MESAASYLLTNFPSTIALLERLLLVFVILIALVVVVMILLRQTKVQKNRLNLALFEKRYEFLQLIRNVASTSLNNDVRYFERIQKEYGRFVQYRLLFPEAIAAEVDKMLANCDELLVSSRNVDAYGREEMSRRVEEEEYAALRQGIRSQMEALEQRIEDFIRIDWQD